MNCPYCNKSIEAMTGFQEIKKFQAHLVKCKEYPKRHVVFNNDYGGLINLTNEPYLEEALKIRAESGQ